MVCLSCTLWPISITFYHKTVSDRVKQQHQDMYQWLFHMFYMLLLLSWPWNSCKKESVFNGRGRFGARETLTLAKVSRLGILMGASDEVVSWLILMAWRTSLSAASRSLFTFDSSSTISEHTNGNNISEVFYSLKKPHVNDVNSVCLRFWGFLLIRTF